jgi:formamidopyrimidine-DNA glycosylase
VPELPEVETVVRDLRGLLVGRRLGAVRVGRKRLRCRWSPAWTPLLLHRTVAGIERRGKWIMIDLDGPWLLVHLGMTGQFRVMAAGARREPHTHIVFPLDEGEHELRYRDVRRFGSMQFFPARDKLDEFLAPTRLGPEPFAMASSWWRACLGGTARGLKALLLDQTVVAGVGNIYADEALHEARLHPALAARDLSARQADALRRAIVRVLTRAIEARGSTIRDYVGGSGLRGGFQREFRVYQRTAQPCSRCKTPIERIVLAGRSTHFCPVCQVAKL